jgi:uncharacterized protein (DUF2132 family)
MTMPETKDDDATTSPPMTTTAPTMPTSATPKKPSKDPLHGVTLEAMVLELVEFFGWQELGERIPIRCFQSEPSVPSSLKFLRKTPWARTKVEGLYLFVQRERVRRARGERPR